MDYLVIDYWPILRPMHPLWSQRITARLWLFLAIVSPLVCTTERREKHFQEGMGVFVSSSVSSLRLQSITAHAGACGCVCERVCEWVCAFARLKLLFLASINAHVAWGFCQWAPITASRPLIGSAQVKGQGSDPAFQWGSGSLADRRTVPRAKNEESAEGNWKFTLIGLFILRGRKTAE